MDGEMTIDIAGKGRGHEVVMRAQEEAIFSDKRC